MLPWLWGQVAATIPAPPGYWLAGWDNPLNGVGEKFL